MKKFAALKSVDEIRAQCRAQGLKLGDKHHRRGGDHIVVEGGGAIVYYNTFNGKFWGRTPTGVQFHSSATIHERQPWFQALLVFFYWEKV